MLFSFVVLHADHACPHLILAPYRYHTPYTVHLLRVLVLVLVQQFKGHYQ
jgi:hypothetical protein